MKKPGGHGKLAAPPTLAAKPIVGGPSRQFPAGKMKSVKTDRGTFSMKSEKPMPKPVFGGKGGF